VIAFQGTCSVADMFTDAMALPKSGADQWFCVSSNCNDSAVTDALHSNNPSCWSASSAPRQIHCTGMAFHLGKHAADCYMPSSPAALPDQATPYHRQQHYGYQLVMHNFMQGQESKIAGGLYNHSGVLHASHAVWRDMTQIGLVQALFYPDETAPRRESNKLKDHRSRRKLFVVQQPQS